MPDTALNQIEGKSCLILDSSHKLEDGKYSNSTVTLSIPVDFE